MREHGLGLILEPDERDFNYPLAKALPKKAPERTYRYWWTGGWWGNQGATPQCVAYSWVHLLEDGPITHNFPAPLVDPQVLYDEAQARDPWPGNAYEGTTVRAGAKALQDRGLIGEYLWAFDAETAIKAVLTRGPVLLGTTWYEGMDRPDKDGIARPDGRSLGGHAYVMNGVNVEKGLVRCKNSWGRSWGQSGFFYLTVEGLQELLSETWAEACMPTEIATKMEYSD